MLSYTELRCDYIATSWSYCACNSLSLRRAISQSPGRATTYRQSLASSNNSQGMGLQFLTTVVVTHVAVGILWLLDGRPSGKVLPLMPPDFYWPTSDLPLCKASMIFEPELPSPRAGFSEAQQSRRLAAGGGGLLLHRPWRRLLLPGRAALRGNTRQPPYRVIHDTCGSDDRGIAGTPPFLPRREWRPNETPEPWLPWAEAKQTPNLQSRHAPVPRPAS